MRRIGSRWAILLLTLAAAALGAEAPEIYQTVDRNELGLDDVLRLTVVTSAPRGAQLSLPSTEDFEVLSRQESSETSFQMINGSAAVKQLHKFILLMRPNRAGSLVIPPAILSSDGKQYRSESVRVTVKKGHVAGPRQQAQRPNPYDPFQQLNRMFGGGLDEDDGFPQPEIPRSGSDLFLKTFVDTSDVYVGQQVTLTLAIYSRVDLSEVTALNMPKLDGFWSEDIDSPSQLAGETKIVNGVPYRVYLLKRRALFPVKPGTLTLSPADVDVITGFLFASQRVHRASNEIPIKVKPLPATGRPTGFPGNNVGNWHLSLEATQAQVELGQPVTVRVTLDGTGNLKNIATPPLTAPSSMRVYDPTTTDKPVVNHGVYGGKRVQEYLVLPQQTGRFTLGPLVLDFFNPQTSRYEQAKTEPLALNVVPGAGGATSVGPKVAQPEMGGKNVLTAGGLRPMRYQASFTSPVPLWKRRAFMPIALTPVGLWAAFGLVSLVRIRSRSEDEASRKKRKAKASRKRLEAAEKLKADRGPEFYGEVEKAMLGFLEAKLGIPVGGLTRDGLAEALRTRGVSAERQQQVISVLEQCDVGRFAPGASAGSRDELLDRAAEVMQRWDDKRGAA